jgi:ABC-transporter N-terminal
MSALVADRGGFSRSPKTGAEPHILLRQLTTHPYQSRSTDLVLSNENLKDVEKGLPDNDGPSNLRDCLTSSNEANKAAGIQPKRVGVIWANLQVIVRGSIDHNVRTCFVGAGTDHLTFQIDIHQDI